MNVQRTRTGWNQKGGSWRDDLEAAKGYWENQARLAARTLKDWLGDDYPVFEEMIFPGDTFYKMSWQAIHGTIANWIASGKDAVMDAMECTCRPDGPACPVCAARARKQEGIPWA
jgi:hypothetical protein